MIISLIIYLRLLTLTFLYPADSSVFLVFFHSGVKFLDYMDLLTYHQSAQGYLEATTSFQPMMRGQVQGQWRNPRGVTATRPYPATRVTMITAEPTSSLPRHTGRDTDSGKSSSAYMY